MKKIIAIGFIFVLTMIFNMPVAKADGNALVPFINGSTSTTVSEENVSGSSYYVYSTKITSAKAGDSTDIIVKLCPFTGESAYTTYQISSCSDVSATWNSSNPSVATVSEGKVTYVSTGTTDITVTSDASTGGQSIKYTFDITIASDSNSNTNTNNNNNKPTEISNNEDEPDVIKEKDKTVPKETTDSEKPISGKQTVSNPATGLKEIAFILVPMLLIGSGLVLRKRFN